MTDPIYPTLTAPVRLSRGDILALIDVLDTAVSTRLTLARGIEDDATGAREGDPEWAAVLDRQARRERDRATRLASLRDRIGGSGMSLIQAPLRSGDATVRSREAIEAAADALEGAMHKGMHRVGCCRHQWTTTGQTFMGVGTVVKYCTCGGYTPRGTS